MYSRNKELAGWTLRVFVAIFIMGLNVGMNLASVTNMKIIVLHSFKVQKNRNGRIWIPFFGNIRRGNLRTTMLLFVFSLFVTTGFIMKMTIDSMKYNVRKESNTMQTSCEKNKAWKDVFQCRARVKKSKMVRRHLL